jgi:predicted nucleotidyltransferase component of viral defense system
VPIRWHVESPDELREAIRLTRDVTGFSQRLIEKDYFCSVVLDAIAETDGPLVFKGGTCLAKVHAGFFRLSEDLDFSIPISSEATKKERSQAIAPVKTMMAGLVKTIPGLETLASLEGHNNSTQYNATLGYRSTLTSEPETIRIEIGLREPVLIPPQGAPVNTALLHWLLGDPLIAPFPVRCLSYAETMAEKLRAALSREEVAIRDFFDIHHAVQAGRLDVADPETLRLLRIKLAVPGTGAVNVSSERHEILRRQVDGELRPVLRVEEFEAFDLAEAFGMVRAVAEGLEPPA